MKKKTKKKRITFSTLDKVVLGISVLTLLFLFILYMTNNIGWIDNIVFKPLDSVRNAVFDWLALFICILGDTIPIIIVSIILLLLIPKDKKGIYAFVNYLFILLLNYLIKVIVQRSRPGNALVYQNGYSFPSGHTMASVALFMTLIYFVDRNKKLSNKAKAFIVIICIIATALVCLSRIYLAVHYASDVIAGVCITLIEMTIFKRLVLDGKR